MRYEDRLDGLEGDFFLLFSAMLAGYDGASTLGYGEQETPHGSVQRSTVWYRPASARYHRERVPKRPGPCATSMLPSAT